MKSTSVVLFIIKVNVAVFFLWYLFLLIEPHFMIQNFLVSWQSILEGRIWTLVTSVFSHNLFFHLFLNMYFFYGFGKALELILGGKVFLKLYLMSGIAGSFGHCFVSAYLLHQPELMALGASGAISGVLVFFALMFPREKVYLLGLFPMPAFLAIFLFVGFDFWGLLAQTEGSQLPIGYGAHLGGALAGGFFYLNYRSHFKFFSE